MIKTGTTIVGLKYKNGVVLLADSRATSGPIVAEKNIQKIHKVTKNIYCAGAGTAADTDRINQYASKELQTFNLRFDELPHMSHYINVVQNRLHRYQGHIGAALIAGGIDNEGNHLYSLSSFGYVKSELFTTLGSGSLAALGILETSFKKDMEEEDAVSLGIEAVKAGIYNDLYSGSNINIVIIRENKETVFEIIKKHIEVVKREGNIKQFKVPNVGIIEKEDVWKYIEEYE
ncbi:putative proteasome subunit beta type-2 [Cucumispora dikerogammari]|nr:putative proteasome subunit beta type-2 [Cucumispora dikerogammari]